MHDFKWPIISTRTRSCLSALALLHSWVRELVCALVTGLCADHRAFTTAAFTAFAPSPAPVVVSSGSYSNAQHIRTKLERRKQTLNWALGQPHDPSAAQVSLSLSLALSLVFSTKPAITDSSQPPLSSA